MKIKATILLLLIGLGLSLSLNSYGQRWKFLRWELMMGLGSTNILGDIGGYPNSSNLFGIRDFTIDQTRPSVDFGIRFRWYEKQVLRLNLNYGYAYGNDKGSINSERNFSYTTNLFEQSLVYEYYFISEEPKHKSASMYNRRGMINNFSKIGMYAFAGAGLAESFTSPVSTFIPTATQFVHTHALTLVLPVGIGVKYIFDEKLAAGIEFGGRYTFSDKLDGYSSAFSKSNDFYYLGSLHLTYRLKTNRNGMPAFLAKKSLGGRR